MAGYRAALDSRRCVTGGTTECDKESDLASWTARMKNHGIPGLKIETGGAQHLSGFRNAGPPTSFGA